MDKQNLLVGDIPGYTPQIARLLSMMNHVRRTTLSNIEGLSTDELDYLSDPGGNSIGSLLLHIAATEVAYQAMTFHKREMNVEEKNEWNAVLTLGEKARQEIKGNELEYYVNKLEQVREITLRELAARDDSWLDEQTAYGANNFVNNYFKWFHVFTHEVNHRGQIRLLRRQAKRM